MQTQDPILKNHFLFQSASEINEDNLKVKENEKSALLAHKSHCANPQHFSAVLSHIWMVDVPH